MTRSEQTGILKIILKIEDLWTEPGSEGSGRLSRSSALIKS